MSNSDLDMTDIQAMYQTLADRFNLFQEAEDYQWSDFADSVNGYNMTVKRVHEAVERYLETEYPEYEEKGEGCEYSDWVQDNDKENF